MTSVLRSVRCTISVGRCIRASGCVSRSENRWLARPAGWCRWSRRSGRRSAAGCPRPSSRRAGVRAQVQLRAGAADRSQAVGADRQAQTAAARQPAECAKAVAAEPFRGRDRAGHPDAAYRTGVIDGVLRVPATLRAADLRLRSARRPTDGAPDLSSSRATTSSSSIGRLGSAERSDRAAAPSRRAGAGRHRGCR